MEDVAEDVQQPSALVGVPAEGRKSPTFSGCLCIKNNFLR